MNADEGAPVQLFEMTRRAAPAIPHCHCVRKKQIKKVRDAVLTRRATCFFIVVLFVAKQK